MLTAWIPLHDCPVEMGPVIYTTEATDGQTWESMRHFNSPDLDSLEARRSAMAPVENGSIGP
jgi:hypothetical protein